MKIIITKDCLSSDTFTMQKHYAGDVVEVRDFTASGLINSGIAVAFQSELQAQFIQASLPPRKVFVAPKTVEETMAYVNATMARMGV